ncbi:MAG: LD-carboxypeptidase [Balneolaceae bacterium]|nr:LD-carboxypeptidase [Balneolaceae bacterium]
MGWSRKDFFKVLGLGSLAGLPISSIACDNDTSKQLIKPKTLSKGDVIGMPSPGFLINDQNAYDEIISTIEKLGFKVKQGKNARNRFGYFAGTDKERAEDINALFSDPEVNAIIPFRGGWGTNRILDLLDYSLIENNPKALIGFSDITALLLAIHTKTGMVTFHGPVGKSEWSDFTVASFESVLMQKNPTELVNPPKSSGFAPSRFRTITSGKCSGKLIGGNLSVLTSMLGSSYIPEWRNAILFVEDVGESVYRIDRMLTQLKLNGILNSINGFIFGRCTDCTKGYEYGFTLEQILDQHIKELEIPAFYGSMIGHLDHMFTVPIGINAEMDSNTGSIKILQSATR